jgi:hypothetical protein
MQLSINQVRVPASFLGTPKKSQSVVNDRRVVRGCSHSADLNHCPLNSAFGRMEQGTIGPAQGGNAVLISTDHDAFYVVHGKLPRSGLMGCLIRQCHCKDLRKQ